jgi:hypothetical protein
LDFTDADVIARMQEIIRRWEDTADRRAVFLTCYMMMTQNMQTAVVQGEFADCTWVDRLLRHFADYYFVALDAYQLDRSSAPKVWQLAHDAALEGHEAALQQLLLGVNAHINYDLVLALADMLDPEWEGLSDNDRRTRYADYCHVNDIIGRTIDAVQDQVLEPAMPSMKLVDWLFGEMDEKLISRIITDWRESVWEYAARLLDTHDPEMRAALVQRVEEDALHRGSVINLWRTR